MKTVCAIAAALLLAGGAGAQRPQANPYGQALAKLGDLPRKGTMRRAVLDMGTTRCDRGADYAVFLGLDGSVQVRPCRDLAQLRLPPCNLPPRKAG